jgi:hypothetical protein
MRAAAMRAPPRARNWQSQRVTPPSGASGTGFHPVPEHNGQTSAAVFIILSLLSGVDSTLHPEPPAPQDETGFWLCTSCGEW